MQASDEDLPWYEEGAWKEHSIEGLEDSTDEWLELLFAVYHQVEDSEGGEAQDGE